MSQFVSPFQTDGRDGTRWDVTRRLSSALASCRIVGWRRVASRTEARFPLAELTARVNGPSWRLTGFHYPSTRPVLTVMETGHPSTRVVETGLDCPVASVNLKWALHCIVTLANKKWQWWQISTEVFSEHDGISSKIRQYLHYSYS